MFQRYASAASVAAMFVALAAAILALSGAVNNSQSLYRVTTAWCFLPFAWGVWAVLAPRSWVPERLPAWGAIFGFLLAAFVLMIANMPRQVFGVEWPVAARAVGVLIGAGVYFALWMIVRAAYRALAAH